MLTGWTNSLVCIKAEAKNNLKISISMLFNIKFQNYEHKIRLRFMMVTLVEDLLIYAWDPHMKEDKL